MIEEPEFGTDGFNAKIQAFAVSKVVLLVFGVGSFYFGIA